jgi:hypothetical protein
MTALARGFAFGFFGFGFGQPESSDEVATRIAARGRSTVLLWRALMITVTS